MAEHYEPLDEDGDSDAVDDGGAPKTLAGVGYRSMHPAVYVAVPAAVIAIAGSVLWAVIGRPNASASASANPPIVAKFADSQDARSVISEPTATPLGVPRTRPLFAVASPVPKHTPEATTTVETTSTTYVPPAPAMAAAPAVPAQPLPRVKSDAEIARDDTARRIAEAARGNSRMTLESQDAQAQRDLSGASVPVAQSVQAAPPASTMFASEPHGSFTARNSGEPGYQAPSSRYELAAGTMIPCRLITTVDSTLLGGVMKAQVVETIFDSATHQVVVLPAGTIAIGRAGSALFGEARLASSWNEFSLPNGRKFFASSNEGAGMKGEAGMPSSVDTHAGRSFGNALVSSILQAGVHLASRANTIDISTGQQAQAQQPLGPTLHAYSGQLFTIILEHDLPLDRYAP
jgi:type IV secretory pathway VirB10-like protein